MRETDFCHNKLYSDNKQPPPPQQRTGVVVGGGRGFSRDRLMAIIAKKFAQVAPRFSPRFSPRRAATRRDPPGPKRPENARNRSLASPAFFRDKTLANFFFLGANFFRQEFAAPTFFLKICFCATAAAVRSELEKHYRFRVKIENIFSAPSAPRILHVFA